MRVQKTSAQSFPPWHGSAQESGCAWPAGRDIYARISHITAPKNMFSSSAESCKELATFAPSHIIHVILP